MSSSPTTAELAERGLARTDLEPDPLVLLRRWTTDAERLGLPEFDAMTLATVDAAGAPRARIVLWKEVDDEGVTFFTNYESDKGRELANDPRAALVLFWAVLGRQVRLEGAVERLPDTKSDAYFAQRHRASQLGAWASRQSRELANRRELDDAVAQVTGEHPEGRPVPRPPHWGGYRLAPRAIEFWKSRPARLHDRFRYTRDGADGWRVARLSP